MKTLALIFIFLGLFVYLKISWQIRASPGKIKLEQIGDMKFAGFIFMYFGVAMAGCQYPSLDRASHTTHGLNTVDLWTSATLAIPMCIYMGFVLRRYKQRDARYFPYLCYFLFVTANYGIFLLLNGFFDFKASEYHVMQVLSKKYSPAASKSPPRYQLFVNDWDNPNDQINLDTHRDLYEKTKNGSKIQIEIGSGLFGVPWVRSVQLD